METFQLPPSCRIAVLVSSFMSILPAFSSGAETLQVPWECSSYQGDAQNRCVNAFMEAQQMKIAELEGKLRAQQGTIGQLKDELDRQSTTTADLQRQLSERSATSLVPIPYPYPYIYAHPPGLRLGFGLYFGGSGMYASPYYGPYFVPLGGPRHYGHWGHRW